MHLTVGFIGSRKPAIPETSATVPKRRATHKVAFVLGFVPSNAHGAGIFHPSDPEIVALCRLIFTNRKKRMVHLWPRLSLRPPQPTLSLVSPSEAGHFLSTVPALVAGRKTRSNQVFQVFPPSMDVTAFSLTSPLA